MQYIKASKRREIRRKIGLVKIWGELSYEDRKAFLAQLDENLVFHRKDAKK
jgi:hypothetical protein